MDWQYTVDGRFTIRHSTKQQAYCESKAVLLADYIATPPRTEPNGGYGDENITFTTITTPVFSFLRALCYVRDPRYPNDPRRLIRQINPAWLARLTWEAIAWWYQDDGTLQGPEGSRCAEFCTHRYPQDQVELLAQMLRDRGIAAKACATKQRGKTYYIIRVSAVSTRIFVKNIAPYVHVSMRYKIDAPDRVLPNCDFCGAVVDTRRFNAERPCCRNPDCKRKRDRERGKKWSDQNREKINAKSKARRDADLETARAKAREDRARRESDPAYRSYWNAHRYAWLQERMEDPQYKAMVRARGLAWHHRRMEDPEFHAKRNAYSNKRAKERRSEKKALAEQQKAQIPTPLNPL